MEKQLTPVQELIKHIERVQFIPKEVQKLFLELEKQSFIDFGSKLLENCTGNNGCGCFKDGGGDKPEELFNETFKTN